MTTHTLARAATAITAVVLAGFLIGCGSGGDDDDDDDDDDDGMRRPVPVLTVER